MEIDVGQIIGRKYLLTRLLGLGAMGQVWVARHEALHQTFAVKIMAGFGDEDPTTSLKRFENEAQIAATLSRKSRHITSVTDHGVDDGVAFLVMELLEGEGLEKRIGYGLRLRPAEVSNVVSQVAKALAVAHAEGVTHRDLKPANVFLTRNEEGELLVKLMDFGIARLARRIVKNDGRAPTRLTVKGLVLGTPAYMSPEQAMAESTDVRVDVWALAVLAFEALAGVTPFEGTTADETIARICKVQPTALRSVLPDAAPELEAVFTRAFQANVSTRFQTAQELSAALVAALPPPALRLSDPLPTLTPTVALASEAPSNKKRTLLLVAAAGGVIAGGVFFGLHRGAETPPHREVTVAAASVTVVQPKLTRTEPSSTPPSIDVTSLPEAPRGVPVKQVAASPTVPSTSTSTSMSASASAPPAPSKSVDRSAIF